MIRQVVSATWSEAQRTILSKAAVDIPLPEVASFVLEYATQRSLPTDELAKYLEYTCLLYTSLPLLRCLYSKFLLLVFSYNGQVNIG